MVIVVAIIVVAMIVMIAAVIVVAMVVAEAVAISITVAIPAMIMFKAASTSFPIAFKKLPILMAGTHPTSSLIGRPGPITVMPFVVMSHRVPISVNPDKFRSGPRG